MLAHLLNPALARRGIHYGWAMVVVTFLVMLSTAAVAMLFSGAALAAAKTETGVIAKIDAKAPSITLKSGKIKTFELGTGVDAIAAVLPRLQPIAGRMNRLGGGDAPLVVVDYSHKPDALQQALESLRGHLRGRLVCVFGCGGERDRGKRPQMAAIAEAAAGLVIVTDDNPRGEDGDAIVADIMAGFADPSKVIVERDRRRAIERAIGAAGPGDIVLVAGKGHETYQDVAGVKHPFDDREVAAAALAARGAGARA